MNISYTLFDTLLEPIFILNSSRQIVYCNESAALLLSSTVRKVTRTQPVITDIFKFSEPIDGLENLTTVTDPTPYKEVNFETLEGNQGKVQITIQILPDTENWIVFIRDVTLEERLQKKYRAELDAKEGVIDELRKAQAELENYSRNLEKMVEERTAEVRTLNQKLTALLDSLDQGFLIFDESGDCWEITSKACEDVLETNPAGQKIWDVLHLPDSQREGFTKWLMTLFGEMLPFDDLVELGPQRFAHSKGKHIELDYYPIRNQDEKIEALVLVATDITNLVEARQQAEKEKAHAGLILKMFQQKRSFLNFYEESQGLMSQLQALTALPQEKWNANDLFRVLHTLKGGAASFSIREITSLAHELEGLLPQLKEDPEAFSRPQWDAITHELTDRYSEFQNFVHHLLGETQYTNVSNVEVPRPDLIRILDILESWSKTKDWAAQLKQHYLMEPLKTSFEAYAHMTQKLAEQLGKRMAPLQFKNPEYRWVYEPHKSFVTSLVHVFRNAIDHGLETPEERRACGKSEEGLISIEVQDQGDNIQIKISDDGRGINIFKIKQKLIEKGISTENLSPHDLAMSIFEPQFSTSTEVTDVSGRGVGLDAVKHEVEKLGGTVNLEFQEGCGTSFIFILPKVAHEMAHPVEQTPSSSSKAA